MCAKCSFFHELRKTRRPKVGRAGRDVDRVQSILVAIAVSSESGLFCCFRVKLTVNHDHAQGGLKNDRAVFFRELQHHFLKLPFQNLFKTIGLRYECGQIWFEIY